MPQSQKTFEQCVKDGQIYVDVAAGVAQGGVTGLMVGEESEQLQVWC